MPATVAAAGRATGTEWAVATPHRAASEAAAACFRRGGNAIDAALAAAGMLTVVYPNQCSVGGDLLALVTSEDGSTTFVNASGRYPAMVDADHVRRDFTAMPVSGALPVTVPGVVSGWDVLARRWGRGTLSAALSDAVVAARDGVPVSAGLARDLAREAGVLAEDDGMRGVFFRDGNVLREGQTLRQPRLAESLERIAAHGAAEMYRGELGATIAAWLQARGSAMTIEDFAAHEVSIEEPVSAVFGERTYLSSASNSQGLFFLEGLSALELLRAEGLELDPLGANAAKIATVLSYAAQDRDRYLADPEYAEIPIEWLLSQERARELADAARTREEARPRTFAPPATGDTVAVVTADAAGNRVSLIQSVFHAFGAAVLEPATGVVLHNRGASFSLDPGAPNVLAGGRRPPHTLMPVLAANDGAIVGVHGAMGGRAQAQVHTHLALQIAAGADPAQAVSRPRWVLGSLEVGSGPASLFDAVKLEASVPDGVLQEMVAWGLPISRLAALDDGVGHAQMITLSAGTLDAASDPRADGEALAS
jgi:gamma-glutamyltranspeptidase/glutathione hydrolase